MTALYIAMLAVLQIVGQWIRSRSVDVPANEGVPLRKWILWGRYFTSTEYAPYVLVRLPGASWEYSICNDDYRWGRPALLWMRGSGWRHLYTFSEL